MRSGFVGTVGGSSPAAERAEAGEGGVLCATDWSWVAARTRPGERLSVSRDTAGVTVALLGLLVDPDVAADAPVTAEGLRTRLRARDGAVGLDLDRCEGSYQVLVVDEPHHTLRLYSDHLSSRPIFHGRSGARFAFGRSESEVAWSLDRGPSLSFEGAAGFLAVGYPLGDLTLTEGVRRLRPARELRVSADGGVAERAWWDLTFADPPPRMRLEEAVEELHALARTSLTHEFAAAETYQLALTGGYDSRLLLGLIRESGRLPETAFTWGHRLDVAGSDPLVASSLAARAGVPHRVLGYAPTDLETHLDAWLRDSALGSDNLGHFCAGGHFLAEHGLAPLPVWLGDHVLGLGGAFASRGDAVAAVLRSPWPSLSPSLRALLAPDLVDRVRDAVAAQLGEILTGADGLAPKDLHHYLYFHVGVFGWLLAPGYYKEPILPARRPLASLALLTAASRWPAELRHDKRVVVALLRERFADLHAVPTADRSALVDWLAAVRDPDGVGRLLAALLADAARGDGLLAGQLRPDAAAQRLAGLQRAPTAADRRHLRAWGVRLRRSLGRLRPTAGPLARLERLARRAAAPEGGRQDDLRHLFRVGLLAAYERRVLAPGSVTPSGTEVRA